jgi:group II intron reverse transcriptase/maturase
MTSSTGEEDRLGKGSNPKPDTYVTEKSDTGIRPEKGPNRPHEQAASGAIGGRTRRKGPVTKGNPKDDTAAGTQRPPTAVHKIQRVREAAPQNRQLRFSNLMHLITPQLLMESFHQLNPRAATGVDEVTWNEYAKEASSALSRLHERVHRGSYRAMPSRRIYISKEDGGQRPIGIAALEDKLVQQAVVTVLNAIYEEDFHGLSYGYRPGRSAHQALDALHVVLTQRKVSWVLDADIRGFFDNLDHEKLLELLRIRIADPRILRLVAKWLRAGVSEEGQWSPTKVGTPQGAVISPLLANIYLHYCLDEWLVEWRKRAGGEVYLIRYADDFVMGFQYRATARRFEREVKARLREFGLELHQDKTRLIEFGRFAAENRRERGEGKPETFNFLGFTHFCTKKRTHGRFTVGRKTRKERLRKKVKETRERLLKDRHKPVKLQGVWLKSVLTGFYNYFGVPGNLASLARVRHEIMMGWWNALRKRSQKARRLSWEKMKVVAETWLPKPRVTHPYPNERFGRRNLVRT